jgi:hypothetical protein
MFHLYADDVYCYLATPPGEVQNAILKMEETLEVIADWMCSHHLSLNPSKTETMLFHNRSSIPNTLTLPINIQNHKIMISTSGCLRLLGVSLDPHLAMDRFVSDKCRSAYIHIRMLSLIRPKISYAHAKLLSQALVMSRIDYCLVLLAGCLSKLTDKLQGMINHTARIVTSGAYRDHASPLLHSLNWYNIKTRIQIRQATILFSVSQGTAPHYLQLEIAPYQPSRCLRSSSKHLITTHHAKRRIGNISFSFWSSEVWNNLPSEAREETRFSAFYALLVKHLCSK